MKYSTKNWLRHIIGVRLQLWVALSCLGLALLGPVVESQGGWVSYPPRPVVLVQVSGGKQRRSGRGRQRVEQGPDWGPLWRSWWVPVLRGLSLGGLWLVSGQRGPGWVIAVPWLVWLWHSSGQLWPGLRRQPEWQVGSWLLWQGQRLVLLGYVGLGVGEALGDGYEMAGREQWGLSLGCVVCGRSEAWVQVEKQSDGSYRAELCGHFQLQVSGDEPFRRRLMILFLRLLEVAGPERVIGRTRDDRAPFVRQMQVAQWFEVPQPNVSRWERYWLAGNWPDLLSEKTAELLTAEVRSRVVQVLAAFPWWGLKQVHHYLQAQGPALTYRQVRQVAQESGFSQLRQQLQERYQFSADSFRPRDEWLVAQLLSQVETLLLRLEAGQGLTSQEQLSLTDLKRLAAETGLSAPPPLKGLPWLLRLEQRLFDQWQPLNDEPVRCIYCGSTQVVRKSRQPRPKKYYDAQGQLQIIEVYRYYCRNQVCDKGSFTNLPPGLTPYCAYRTQTKLLALQMYTWGYSTYRRTGQALGLKSMTIYRWVKVWGEELLPVAALFGVVRSSGVVGIDEKYVLVPKNDKPADKMRRWMYVYVAVDVYTYDLLHIAIYAYNDKNTALAFLLALRAKGYQPRVIVTDLRRDYGPDIAQVFPQAVHHECLFHALQYVSSLCRKLYGRDYAQSQPEVESLRQAIVQIFQAKTKRTAQKRYDQVLALRDPFASKRPELIPIFDFLERHWPKLVNAIESRLIPKTNNATELVIRRFDQHYQSFCGFNSIQSAQSFLAVFEKVYRFTPFSDDAQPAIRGKCPLELAGYDISHLPLAALFKGLSFDCPLEVSHFDVPF